MLTAHEVMLQDNKGIIWEGIVITHLPLQQWAEMQHYLILKRGDFLPAAADQRTNLRPFVARKISGVHLAPQNIQQLKDETEE